MIQDKLISKIQKLITLASDGGATVEEADTAQQMANKLLLMHNLTMSDVKISSNSSSKKVETQRTSIGQVKEEGQWEPSLIATICEYNLCRSIVTRKRGFREATITVIGKRDNVDVVLYLFDVARNLYRRSSKDMYNAYRREMIDENSHLGLTELELQKAKKLAYRTVWIRSYLKGCVAGLFSKLESQRKQIERDQQKVSNQFGLMVVDNKKQITDYMEKNYSDLGKERKWKVDAESKAFSAGVDYGKDAELVAGLGQSSSKKISAQPVA